MFIRTAETYDQKAWLALRQALWPDSASEHERAVEAYFAGACRDIRICYVLASDSGSLEGFIELNLRNYAEGSSAAQVPYVEGWYITPEYRNQGWGKALIQQAEDWARAEGFSELASDTELDNQVSIAAHQALGFVETERMVCFLKAL